MLQTWLPAVFAARLRQQKRGEPLSQPLMVGLSGTDVFTHEHPCNAQWDGGAGSLARVFLTQQQKQSEAWGHHTVSTPRATSHPCPEQREQQQGEKHRQCAGEDNFPGLAHGAKDGDDSAPGTMWGMDQT